MGRIRIAGRLALIVVGATVLVQLLMAAVFIADYRRDTGRTAIVPLLNQVAALTQALDRLPTADRDLVLQAATNTRFIPAIQAERPANVIHSAVLGRAEQRLLNLIGPPQDRFIALSLVTGGQNGNRPLTRLRDLVGSRVRAVIALQSGGYLDIDAGGELTLRLFGVPAGLLAGILGFAVALAAIIAVRHETRPLSALTTAVDRFGEAIEPQAIAERGAPDLRRLIKAVNTMQERIAGLIRSRTLVLGAISHDLRTYVTRLQLRLEMLPDSAPRTKAIADLNAMQALMDDALAFAQASFVSGPVETVDLTRIARAECETRIAHGAAVTLNPPDFSTPLWVRATPAALGRVIANLIDNAVAYGGGAEVSVYASPDAVELLIEDRGPGIPAAERTRVFEPFYRLEPSRNRNSGGAGLGLTIVRQIVEAQGGSVTIEDRPGGGARLRVSLPRVTGNR
ncbi:MAG: ATP-binding protein [Rhodopseudomonas sp.]|nr:ATP-binding protein [Rhodopseudomonas sp.]